LARVEKHLKPLTLACQLRDTATCKVAMQVQLEINRFCANTMLNYFLRTMPVEATAAAAARHDELIAEALHAVAASTGATAAERRRAEEVARDALLSGLMLPPPPAGASSDSMVPGADVVLSGYSTTNYLAILWQVRRRSAALRRCVVRFSSTHGSRCGLFESAWTSRTALETLGFV
jgi:hypothetical protein